MSKPIDDLIAKYGGSELPRVTRKVRKTTSELAWKRGFDEARAATAAREIIEHSRAAAARREGIERTGEIPIDLESLVESISIVKHAVSADTTRPQFNSVLIEGSRGMLSVTATDGVRLCHVELPCEHVPHVGFLIPLQGKRHRDEDVEEWAIESWRAEQEKPVGERQATVIIEARNAMDAAGGKGHVWWQDGVFRGPSVDPRQAGWGW